VSNQPRPTLCHVHLSNLSEKIVLMPRTIMRLIRLGGNALSEYYWALACWRCRIQRNPYEEKKIAKSKYVQVKTFVEINHNCHLISRWIHVNQTRRIWISGVIPAKCRTPEHWVGIKHRSSYSEYEINMVRRVYRSTSDVIVFVRWPYR
jgi:hypothetical protein